MPAGWDAVDPIASTCMPGPRDLPRSLRGPLAVLVAVLLVGSLVGVARLRSSSETGQQVASEAPTSTAVPEPPAPPATAELVADAPPSSIVPATTPATTAAPATSAARPAPGDRIAPFRGLGTWVDVFEWAPAYAKPGKPVDLAPTAVDAMAAAGIQVLYIQASRFNNPTGGDIVDPEVLAEWLARAKAKGITVVAWYLPTLTDPAADLRRLKAIAKLPDVAAVGVDIESTAVKDPAVRSARMVELSKAVRAAMPDRPLSAIVLPAVDTDVVNLKYWPGFPWKEIRGIYDVWQPMGYWTNRTAASGYRNAERYTRENVERLRAHLGDPNAPVHPIGGIMNKATTGDVTSYLKAVRDTGCIGASLYTWFTSKPEVHPLMRAARS